MVYLAVISDVQLKATYVIDVLSLSGFRNKQKQPCSNLWIDVVIKKKKKKRQISLPKGKQCLDINRCKIFKCQTHKPLVIYDK